MGRDIYPILFAVHGTAGFPFAAFRHFSRIISDPGADVPGYDVVQVLSTYAMTFT